MDDTEVVTHQRDEIDQQQSQEDVTQPCLSKVEISVDNSVDTISSPIHNKENQIGTSIFSTKIDDKNQEPISYQ